MKNFYYFDKKNSCRRVWFVINIITTPYIFTSLSEPCIAVFAFFTSKTL